MEENRFELFYSLINSASKSIQRIKAEKMKKYRLSAAHTTCLCRLAASGDQGLTQGQLAALEAMDRAQISRVLADLRDRGYVLPADHTERYKQHYTLSDSGREIAAEVQSIILDIHRFVSADLPEADIQTFYRTLRVIARNLSRAADTYLK